MEEWKDVPGYEGIYQVSNLGRVMSLSYRQTGREQIMLLRKARNGYLCVDLCKDGKRKLHYVHRLVWEVFKGPIHNGMQVNHINEDKTDNRLENLNLMTPKENSNWGTRSRRSAKSRSRMVEQYTLEGEHFMTWFSAKSVEEELGHLGFSRGHISACCLGNRKSHKGFIWRYTE